MTPKLRRLLAGQSSDGTSILGPDEELSPLRFDNGFLFWLVWGADSIPVDLPTSGEPSFVESRFPPERGVRLIVADYPPADSEGPPGDNAPPAELPPDLDKTVMHDHETGMHMTDTVDIGIVLRGEIGLEQGDGHEVTLREGDIVVQHGGLHGWRRRNVPCRMAFIILGATRHQAPVS